MTTILLFGAGGQLAREIIARAPAFNIDVVACSRTETDIADAAGVAAAIHATKPQLVLNAAGYTKVDKAESEPDEAHRVNALGAGNVAQDCAAAGVPLIHFSTDYVFDGKKPSPYTERDATGPLNVYGTSKFAGEQAVRANHQKHLILRTSWLYGQYGANFLRTMLKLAGERDELRIVADQRGSPTCTLDLADTVLRLTPKLLDDALWGTYHFSGDGETNWCQLADEILKAREKWTGSRPKLVPITTAEYPTAARRPLNSVLNTSLFRATFGLQARPWRNAVQETVDALMGRVRA